MNRIKSVLVAAGATVMLASPVMVEAGTPWDRVFNNTNRFVVLKEFNELAVRDRETGLVWERYPHTTTRLWQTAQVFCYAQEVGGRKGWRIPTIEELASLVDSSQYGPALPAGHPFEIPEDVSFWSATSSHSTANFAYAVHFVNGQLFVGNKVTAPQSAWCVRGGSGYDGQFD